MFYKESGYGNPIYAKIVRLARQYYPKSGPNSWEHIKQVLANQRRMVRYLEHRELTPLEYAAAAFHDSSVKGLRGGKDNHGIWSSLLAVKALKPTKMFSKEELRTLRKAIIEHDTLDRKGGFSSKVGDLLASADANPPNIPWILNKSYTWGTAHGLDVPGRIANMHKNLPKWYNSVASTVYPEYYKKYYGEAVKAMQKQFDMLTPERMQRIVDAFRKKHKLVEGDLRMPITSFGPK